MTAPCFGILLAGGRASRMGGGDKGLRRIGGATILARVIATMAHQCAGLVLNANGDPARFAAYGLPVIADSLRRVPGAARRRSRRPRLGCRQSPGISRSRSARRPTRPSCRPISWRAFRRPGFEKGADIACARSASGAHPVIALWPVAIRGALRHALVDEDLHKVGLFTQRYRLAYADWAAAPVDPFFNANEPADLAIAEAIAEARKIFFSR